MNPNPSLERYQEALSKIVCTKCLERTGRGVCSIGGTEECAINRYLPEVVSIVETIDSSVMHGYVHELHNVVCVSCRENRRLQVASNARMRIGPLFPADCSYD